MGRPRVESPSSPHSWVPWTHHPILANDHGHDDLVLEVQRDEQRRPNCERERERERERRGAWGGYSTQRGWKMGRNWEAEARMQCQLCSSRAAETGTLAPREGGWKYPLAPCPRSPSVASRCLSQCPFCVSRARMGLWLLLL